ncbi:hypothetical protein D3C76_750480 [compost metagenome]
MNGCARAVQRDPFQTHQGQCHEGDCRQPAQGNPDDRVGLPDHVTGYLRILDEAQDRGVDPHAKVGVMAKIDDVDQQHSAEDGDQVQTVDDAQEAAADKVPARDPGQQRPRQHDQDGQAQVEAKADAQGCQDVLVAQGFGVKTGIAEKEQHPQQCKQHEQDCCCAQPVMQSSRFQPAHASFLIENFVEFQTPRSVMSRRYVQRAASTSSARQQYRPSSGSTR